MELDLQKLASDIVATRSFRRVMNVSFLGVVDLYNKIENSNRPAFSRAEHSMGVLRLGVVAAMHAKLAPEDAAYLFATCLIHDLGHPPFSHSLEYAFPKSRRTIDHHKYLCEILTAPMGYEREVSRVLHQHGISANRVYDIVDGTDALSFFFDSSINLDTLDGISRSMRSLGLFQKYDIEFLAGNVGRIYSGASVRDLKFIEHADAFWQDKDLFYKMLSSENNFARTEWNFQSSVRRHIEALTRAHFRMNDRDFQLRYPEIMIETLNGYELHRPARTQEFRINSSVVPVDKRSINDRYVRRRDEIQRDKKLA